VATLGDGDRNTKSISSNGKLELLREINFRWTAGGTVEWQSRFQFLAQTLLLLFFFTPTSFFEQKT
jgi:hypothetical protein